MCCSCCVYIYTPRHVISLFNNQYSPHPPPFSSPPYYYIAAYRYKLDLLALANCKQQQPPILPPFLTSITTPLNLAAWAQELENHPHQEVAQYLLQGISQGFRIGFNYPRKCQSAKSNKHEVCKREPSSY